MKKLIIILIFIIPFALQGQNWKIDFNEPDKQAHFAFGYFTGVVFNCAAYDVLKDTRLKPFWSKAISAGIGILAGATIGHLKEKYDFNKSGNYNRKDFNSTLLGGVCGSFTVRLVLWNGIPRSKVPEGKTIYDNRIDILEIYIKRKLKKNKRNKNLI